MLGATHVANVDAVEQHHQLGRVHLDRAPIPVLLVGGMIGSSVSHAALSLAIVVTSMLLTIRSPFGHDGADQMGTLTFSALALGYAVGGAAIGLALWFVALQAILSYA